MRKAPSDIQRSVEGSFRKLILEKGYRSVSVSDIADGAHLSRHSFYEYYANKEDVLSSIFSQDAMKPLKDAHALFSLEERRDMPRISELLLGKMYQGVYDNGDFYYHLVKPMKGNDDTFIRVVTNAIYDFDMDLLVSMGLDSAQKETEYSAYVFAASQAMLMQKWIAADYDMSVEEITALYTQIMTPFWLARTA